MRVYDAPPGFEFNPRGMGKQYQKRIGALEAENRRLKKGLESIAASTCCEGCQEAKRVALKALGRKEGQ